MRDLWRARRDGNESQIIQALNQVGANVLRLSIPNAPDLLVSFQKRLFLLEVKAPKGRVSKGQSEFAAIWPVCIVRTVNEALRAIGVPVEEEENGK